MIRGFVLAALAAGLAPSVATAQSLTALPATSTPQNMAALFKTLCLDHVGDPVAQTAIATAAPWNFQSFLVKQDVGGVLMAGGFQLAIDPKGENCSLSSDMPMNADVADYAAKASPVLGRGDATVSGDTASWTGSSPAEAEVGFLTLKGRMVRVVTFFVKTKAPPAK